MKEEKGHKMLSTETFSSFGLNRMKKTHASALVIYEDNEMFQDEDFLIYIEEIMINVGKCTAFLSKAVIRANKQDFLIDFHTARFEFDLVNQVMFFKDNKLTSTLFIEDLFEEFKNIN